MRVLVIFPLICLAVFVMMNGLHEYGHVTETRGNYNEMCVLGWNNHLNTTSWTSGYFAENRGLDGPGSIIGLLVFAAAATALLTSFFIKYLSRDKSL